MVGNLPVAEIVYWGVSCNDKSFAIGILFSLFLIPSKKTGTSFFSKFRQFFL